MTKSTNFFKRFAVLVPSWPRFERNDFSTFLISKLIFRMILRKQIIKHFFCNFILNNHVSAVYLRKKEWIHRRHCVNVSDDITTTKAIRRVNAKMF